MPSTGLAPRRSVGEPLRVAFLGSAAWLENCAPPAMAHGFAVGRIATGPTADAGESLTGLNRFRPHVAVLFDPPSVPAELMAALSGLRLGVLVGGLPGADWTGEVGDLNRVVSFRPELTGEEIGDSHVWRAIPPPISDALFAEVRPLHARPRAVSVGRSTEHREDVLMPAKHHHDVLQLIHGVHGQDLANLLRGFDVGVHVAPELGGGFGAQVGMHLAAGQLLLTEALRPAHGLERNIDYLQFDSADELVERLDRLHRFPEMHERIRIRGRLKAEQYRASRVFARLLADLLADVAAFGPRL